MYWIATGLTSDVTGVERLVIESVRAYAELDAGPQTLVVDATASWADELVGLAEIRVVARRRGGVARRPSTHLSSMQCDVAHSFAAPFPSGMGSTFRGYTLHDWGPFFDRGMALSARVAWSAAIVRGLRQADAIHVLSPTMLHEAPVPLRPLVNRKQHVLGLPYRLTPVATDSRKRRNGSKTVLAVGSHVPRKRFDLLAEACQTLPELELVIAGRDTEKLTTGTSATGTSVLGLGRVTDDELNELYARSALFVLPSTYEGFGLPVLEAWRAGCPVLVTRQVASRLPPVVNRSVHLIPEPVTTETLASAVSEALTDSEPAAQSHVLPYDQQGPVLVEILAQMTRKRSG